MDAYQFKVCKKLFKLYILPHGQRERNVSECGLLKFLFRSLLPESISTFLQRSLHCSVHDVGSGRHIRLWVAKIPLQRSWLVVKFIQSSCVNCQYLCHSLYVLCAPPSPSPLSSVFNLFFHLTPFSFSSSSILIRCTSCSSPLCVSFSISRPVCLFNSLPFFSSFCLTLNLFYFLFFCMVPTHRNRISLLIHVALRYRFILALLCFFWSRLCITCPRRRHAVPPSLYFHTWLP